MAGYLGYSTDETPRSTHRWIVRHLFKVEPWRIVMHLRAFKGNGLANFEFEFRFGFPRHSRNCAKQIEEMNRGI